MPKKEIPNHIHSYIRLRNKNYFKCTHPDCRHTSSRDILEGKRAVCEGCGDQFFLDRVQLRNKIPHCPACVNSPKAALIRQKRQEAANLDISEIDALFEISVDFENNLDIDTK